MEEPTIVSVRPNHRTTETNRTETGIGSVRLGSVDSTETPNLPKPPKLAEPTEPYRNHRNLPNQPNLTETTDTSRNNRNLPKLPILTEPADFDEDFEQFYRKDL